MPLHIVHSRRIADHVPPSGHPERPERAHAMTAVADRWRGRGTPVIEPRAASRAELARVHDDAYLDQLEDAAGKPSTLDPDTFTSAGSYDVARRAAGAACQAVELALAHDVPACALVRPPGHHAERDKAMGFCLLNNVAVAAAHARALGYARVAVMDVDVHHGNGTQWMFYDDPGVLYLSTHQWPYYPGTGAAEEIGRGAGEGFTVNIPLAAGAGDADYDLVFRRVVVPVLQSFDADLLLVSAGFDLHARDPLGGMRVSTAGVAGLVSHLRAVAAATASSNRVVVVTEGGYDIEALGACLEATLDVLDGAPRWPGAVEGDVRRAEAALLQVRAAQGPRWATL